MSVRTIVGFVADFPVEDIGDDPAGKKLAEFLVEHLIQEGFTVDGPIEREGWAWELYASQNELKLMAIVGLVDDMERTPPRQWLITSHCELGFFKRLFGNKALTEKRDQFLHAFCGKLHSIISSDSRFSHIHWYNEKTFDKPGDQPDTAPFQLWSNTTT